MKKNLQQNFIAENFSILSNKKSSFDYSKRKKLFSWNGNAESFVTIFNDQN